MSIPTKRSMNAAARGPSKPPTAIGRARVRAKDEPNILIEDERLFLIQLKPEDQTNQNTQIVQIARKNPIAFFNILNLQNRNFRLHQKKALFDHLIKQYGISTLIQCVKNMD